MNMRENLGMFFGVLLGIIFGLTSISACSTSEPGVGLLYKAIEIGEMEKAKELLAGIDVNTQDFLGYTPLYKAVFYNRVNFVKYLFFIGKNKSEMYFFKEFFNENECIVLHQFNELLIEFDITKCKF